MSLVTEVFSSREPVITTMKYTYEELLPDFSNICNPKNGLCSVAIDKSTDKVVAVDISDDYADPEINPDYP